MCQWWGGLECLGNRGRLGLPTVGGMERRGCTQTHQTGGMGEGLVGGGRVGVGGQLGSQAAGRARIREGLGWMVLTVCLG